MLYCLYRYIINYKTMSYLLKQKFAMNEIERYTRYWNEMTDIEREIDKANAKIGDEYSITALLERARAELDAATETVNDEIAEQTRADDVREYIRMCEANAKYDDDGEESFDDPNYPPEPFNINDLEEDTKATFFSRPNRNK